MDKDRYMDHEYYSNGVALKHGLRIVTKMLVNVPCCNCSCSNCAPSCKCLFTLSSHPIQSPGNVFFLCSCSRATLDKAARMHQWNQTHREGEGGGSCRSMGILISLGLNDAQESFHMAWESTLKYHRRTNLQHKEHTKVFTVCAFPNIREWMRNYSK